MTDISSAALDWASVLFLVLGIGTFYGAIHFCRKENRSWQTSSRAWKESAQAWQKTAGVWKDTALDLMTPEQREKVTSRLALEELRLQFDDIDADADKPQP